MGDGLSGSDLRAFPCSPSTSSSTRMPLRGGMLFENSVSLFEVDSMLDLPLGTVRVDHPIGREGQKVDIRTCSSLTDVASVSVGFVKHAPTHQDGALPSGQLASQELRFPSGWRSGQTGSGRRFTASRSAVPKAMRNSVPMLNLQMRLCGGQIGALSLRHARPTVDDQVAPWSPPRSRGGDQGQALRRRLAADAGCRSKWPSRPRRFHAQSGRLRPGRSRLRRHRRHSRQSRSHPRRISRPHGPVRPPPPSRRCSAASGSRDPSNITEVKPASSAARHSSSEYAVVQMGHDGNAGAFGQMAEHAAKDRQRRVLAASRPGLQDHRRALRLGRGDIGAHVFPAQADQARARHSRLSAPVAARRDSVTRVI